MDVTDVLLSQHLALLAVFDSMTQVLGDSDSPGEVAAFARLAEGLVHAHAGAEENFLFRPLDALLHDKGKLSRFYSEHKEYTALLQKPQTAATAREARDHLAVAFRILRDHFAAEERVAVPLARATFQPESLAKLGEAWLQQQGQWPGRDG